MQDLNREYSMTDMNEFKELIKARLKELGLRMQDIEQELDQPKSRDLGEQAVDLEDDEVLESIGLVAQKEVALLQGALARIKDGTYGICRECDGEISQARLHAVPYAVLCRSCATAAERNRA